jgi:hypothetical protein
MDEGLDDAELLVKHGFFEDKHADKYDYNDDKGYYVPTNPDQGYVGDHADQEIDEEANISQNKQFYPTEYPKPTKRYRMIYESFNMSLEEFYYWTLNHLREDLGFPTIHKITDIFSASENSSMFGQQAQRKSIQEDRASNYLQGISELVKTLFQIVRELRVIDQRLEVYEKQETSQTADKTLKGIYADFAENQGQQTQPGSIYQLANQVGYAVLPDLFFNTWVTEKDEIENVVDDAEFNEQVKNIVKRKLYQYLNWKEKTWKELKQRRAFQIRYLRQHYTVIKSYIGWVKPYLKHIRRLQMNEDELDSPDIITSFETSSSEIEVLGVKPNPGNTHNSCVLMTYKYNTRPVMQYQQERHQGPSHIGKCMMTIRTYAWTDKEVEQYKRMRQDQELELLGMVDDKLGSAMDMLGDELEQYLHEAEADLDDDPYTSSTNQSQSDDANGGSLSKVGEPLGSAYEPFTSAGKGLYEIASLFAPDLSDMLSTPDRSGPDSDPDDAAEQAQFAARMVYKNYKRAHGLIVDRRG